MTDRKDELATRKDLRQLGNSLTEKIGANAEKIASVERNLTEKIEANAEKIADVERNLTEKIEANAEKIEANAEKIARVEKSLTEKIEANAEKIDANAERIEANAKKIDANAVRLDKLTVLVLENRDRIGQMVTRDEFNRRMDEVMASLDGLTGFFSRLDQERVATGARIDRIEGDVRTNTAEIKRIKTKLGMQ